MIIHKCPNCEKDERETNFQVAVLYSKEVTFENGEEVYGRATDVLDLPEGIPPYYCESCGSEFDEFVKVYEEE